MDTIKYILDKYKLKYNKGIQLPIEIPNVNRLDLALLFQELGFKEGVEVGVEKGIFSKALCEANPSLQLHCVDVWESYSGYKDFVQSMGSNYEEAKWRLNQYNCNLIKKYSMDAVNDFKDNSLDFVYIDGNHELKYVIEDIIGWSKKVKVGGIICGDDYRKHPVPSRVHVVEAVNNYTHLYNIKPWFILGARAKTEGMKRDNNRNYMWVKI